MLMPQGTVYLSGARTPLLDAQVRFANDNANTSYEAPPIGILLTPKTPDRPDDFTPEVASIYNLVGLDNGCFTASGQARFRALGIDGYIRLGRRAVELWGDGMLFVTAPDVPMDWAGTLRASLPVLAKIRAALPSRAALVLQDGAEPGNVPWDAIDWVFLGGSTEWKIGRAARACALKARRRGKGVHMGRVNSLERMVHMMELLRISILSLEVSAQCLDRVVPWPGADVCGTNASNDHSSEVAKLAVVAVIQSTPPHFAID